VPSYFKARLALALAGDYEATACEIGRMEFNDAVFANHTQINSFGEYYKRWSPVQAIVIGQQLIHKDLNGEYKDAYSQYRESCETLYGADFIAVQRQCLEWRDEAAQLRLNNMIVAEAKSFRGTSSLQCAVLDCSSGSNPKMKTYGLPGLIGNYHIEALEKCEFKRIAGKNAPSWIDYCQFFFKVRGIKEKRDRWNFVMDSRKIRKFEGKLSIVHGLEIYGRSSFDIDRKSLNYAAFVAFIVPVDVDRLKSELKLPLHFPLYSLNDNFHSDYCPWAIAFDQSALILDAYLGKGDVIQRDMIAHYSKSIMQSEIDEDERFMARFHQQFASELALEGLND
jgi:CRISPR-associated endonuclease/helicase Cas3